MARKRNKPRRKPKKRNHQVINNEEQPEIVEAPHSFVIHRGQSCPYIIDLTKDFRRIMEPFTAINLKERKANKIKDFVSLSSVFHVSHMCIFNKATTQLSFKIARLPRGPTLTFKIHQFTLAKDVIASSKKQFVDDECFQNAPLVIMNNFSGEGKHLKLMATTFQNMFPSINLPTVNLKNLKRCLLFSYNPIAKVVEMRHYSIVVVPVGLSRSVKKVVLGKIPNLSRCDDISDFITNGTGMSDSEYEDDEQSHIILGQDLKRKGNLENNKSSIRLYEIGPRITFELIKIEDGLLTGEILYHEKITKTDEEIEAIRKEREKKKKLKEQRRHVQEENKKRKEKLEKIKQEKKQKQNIELPEETIVEPDDDAKYYKEEIGEEPNEELFKTTEYNPRKRIKLPRHMFAKESKKRKLDNDQKMKNSKNNQSYDGDNKKYKNSSKIQRKRTAITKLNKKSKGKK